MRGEGWGEVGVGGRAEDRRSLVIRKTGEEEKGLSWRWPPRGRVPGGDTSRLGAGAALPATPPLSDASKYGGNKVSGVSGFRNCSGRGKQGPELQAKPSHLAAAI